MSDDSALLAALDRPYRQRVEAVSEVLGKPLRMLSGGELIDLVTTADPVTGPSTWLIGANGVWGITATATWPLDVTLLVRVDPEGVWRGLLVIDGAAWPIGIAETSEYIDAWVSGLLAYWVIRAMTMLVNDNWDAIHPR